MAASFIAVPIAYHHLGNARYGLLVTITSLTAIFAFGDLGIGNGLMSSLARAHATDDRASARNQVASSAMALTVIAIVLGAIFTLVYAHISWADLFNVVDIMAATEAAPAVAVLAACFLISLPMTLVEKVEFGYQSGYAYNIRLALASFLALGAMIVGVGVDAGVPWFVFTLTCVPGLAALLDMPTLFRRRYPWLRFSRSDASIATARRVMGTGVLFFALQVSVVLAYYADNLIIARVLGVSSVAAYSIPWRLFNLIPLTVAMIVAPLWPAYSEAAERGDTEWIRAAFSRSLTTTLVIAIPVAAALVFFGDGVIDLWVGGSVKPGGSLLLGLATWSVLGSYGITLSMLLNGLGRVRMQVYLASLMTFLNVGLSIYLCGRIGVAGAIWGTVISYFVTIAVPVTLFIPALLRVGARGDSREPPSSEIVDQDMLDREPYLR